MTQELLYSTTLRLKGPWLLETKQLLALDDILGDIPEGQKSLTVFLSNDRELKSSSFKEAMAHIGSLNELAKGFEYTATTESVRASVRLVRKQTDKKGEPNAHFFEIKVSPQSEVASYDIFLKLKDWADGVAAPLWQQWLLFEPRPLYRFGLAFTLLIFGLVIFNPGPSTSDYKDAVRQEARTLLRDGINQQNQSRAIELLLALQSDTLPPGIKPIQSRKPIGWFVVAGYVLGFLSFTPTLCLGMWAGKRRLRWWNLWMRFNTVTVPALVLARWVYPQLFSTLEAALRL
jgi:hypothetical protein